MQYLQDSTSMQQSCVTGHKIDYVVYIVTKLINSYFPILFGFRSGIEKNNMEIK